MGFAIPCAKCNARAKLELPAVFSALCTYCLTALNERQLEAYQRLLQAREHLRLCGEESRSDTECDAAWTTAKQVEADLRALGVRVELAARPGR